MNNWYSKYWKYRFASAWHELGDTVTLYHGTNEANLRDILEHGFKHVDFDSYRDIINALLNREGYSLDDFPKWVWEGEFNYRVNSPNTCFTTKKDQASSYAKGSSKGGGEVMSVILRNINSHLEEVGKAPIPIPFLRPVVITIEIPWEMVKSSGNTNFSELVNKLTKFDKEEREEIINDVAFEFTSNKPIPKEYITDWEVI